MATTNDLQSNLEAAVPRRAALASEVRTPAAARLGRSRGRRLGALCLALALGGSGGGVQPAYAVTVNPDGSVVLSVRELLGRGPGERPPRTPRRCARVSSGVRPAAPLACECTLLPPGELGRQPTRSRFLAVSSAVSRNRALELQAERVAAELRFLQSMLRPSKAKGKFEVVINPAAIPRGETLLLAFRTVHQPGRSRR